MKLEGKIAIVTGAGMGIGETIALTLAREGANVVVVDINLETASQTAEQIKSLGRKSLALKVDVSRSEDVNQMVKRAVETFGKIDILVNNAGIEKLAPALDFTEADWDRIVAVNLKGEFLCAQAVGRQMIKQKSGKIII